MMSGQSLTRSRGSREGSKRAYLVGVDGRSETVGTAARVVGLVMRAPGRRNQPLSIERRSVLSLVEAVHPAPLSRWLLSMAQG